MKNLFVSIMVMFLLSTANACLLHQEEMHEMQHGFILGDDGSFASHLVANGHHSRQVDVVGELNIDSPAEFEFYLNRRKANGEGKNYFLFQAQKLDLPSLKDEQVLIGHIIESKVGEYEPKNIVVRNAKFKVQRVLINIENPFFGSN